MSIEQLVQAAQRSDDDAFYALMQQHRHQLYRMALAYLRNEQDALEAVQETTYRAYKQLSKLKDASYFRTWLIRILLNYCNDQVKRRKRWLPLNAVRREPALTEGTDARIDVEMAVDGLKPKLKQVVIMKYFEDMKLSDIARVIRRPEGTVKTRLRQALMELKNKLAEEERHV